MSIRLSRQVSEAVAQDFLDGSVDLMADGVQQVGTQYQIEGQFTTVRTEQEDGGGTLIPEMLTADFVAGVAFALAEQGEVPPELVTTQNLARICLALGFKAGTQAIILEP